MIDNLQAQEKHINGRKVIVSPLLGRAAIKMKLRVVKTLLPAIAPIFENIGDLKGLSLDSEIDLSKFAGALQQAALHLNEDVLFNLITDLLAGAMLDGKVIDDQLIDIEFMGSEGMILMYKILAYVLEVNFGGFFAKGGILNAIAK